MRIRPLLAASATGALLAGLATAPSSADPGPLPAERSGHLETWGSEGGADAIAVPAALDGQQIVDLATSSGGTAAVTAEGALHVWGNDIAGEVTLAPTDVTGAAAVSLFTNGGAVLKSDGSVVAWGANSGMKAVPSGLRAKAVSAGTQNIYAVTTAGTLADWGAEHDPGNPAPPPNLTGLVDVSAAGALTLALDADGDVTAWGALAMLAPTPLEIQGHVAQISTGGAAGAGAILDDGSIVTWGLNVPATPAPIAEALDGKKVVSLDVDANVVAATEDGQVYAWGPTADITTLPEALDGEKVGAVSVSQYHAAVVVTDFHAVNRPTITGSPEIGQTLRATPATFSFAPDSPATGQWLANGNPIAGATGTTLHLDAALLNSKVSYRTSAVRGAEQAASTSTPVTVKKATSTLKASKAKVVGKRGTQARQVVLKVRVSTLSGESAQGKVKVVLKGNGLKKRKATAKVNAKGVATVVLKNVRRGSYKATWTYQGSATVDAATVTVKAKV